MVTGPLPGIPTAYPTDDLLASAAQKYLDAAVAPEVDGALLVTPLGWTPGHSAAAGTVTYKTGAGVFHAVTINSLGTIASTVTVYDNTAGSGTVLAVIDSLTLKGQFVYDLAFTVGLTIVATGTAGPDISVAYR